jgi:phenylpyruvate tautomerase PptA (4-oxalocrotonate tautomerase family)
MPLARIDLAEGKTADYRRTIGEVVDDALVEVLKAPKNDRFQVITEYPTQDFIFDPGFWGIQRSVFYPAHAQCLANRGSETCLLQSDGGRTARAYQPTPGRRVHLSGCGRQRELVVWQR